MPLAMNGSVIITCALTGSGGTQDKSPHVSRSPKQIADAPVDAAKAGAAVLAKLAAFAEEHAGLPRPETAGKGIAA